MQTKDMRTETPHGDGTPTTLPSAHTKPLAAQPPRVLRVATIDETVDALVAVIQRSHAERGPLAPVDVVVPHRAMGEWLTNELSARRGAIAHVRMMSVATLLSDAGHSRDAVRAAVHAGLVAACDPEATAAVAQRFAAVRAYVQRDGDDGDRRELRLAVLSEHVADTFSTYTAHWPHAETLLASRGASGAWQAELFALTAAARSFAPDPEANGQPPFPPLVIFDVPTMGHDAIRAALWRRCDITVLARSPDAARASHVWHRHGSLRASTPARWHTHGAADEASSTSQPRHVTSPGAHPASSSTLAPPQPALRVTRLDAPSIRRACEAVAARIWEWVRDSTTTTRVRFHECAVIVPAPMRDVVLPTLREAFAEAHNLPRVVWRQPLGTHNNVVALVRQLLDLPSTRMRRSDVLSILSHPLMAQAWPDDLPENWSAWLDAVGVFHGLDAASHAGTYLADDVAADWDQGLQRLALGAFVGAERSGAVQSLESPRGPLWPEEVAQSATASLGLLIQLIRSLLCDADFIRRARLPASEWAELLKLFITTYVRPTSVSEGRVRAALLRALDGLGTCGLAGEFGWETARREALACLDGAHAHHGQHLFQGVVIGTPHDLRGIPFRRVAVLGVQQGGFPAAARQDELDLRPNDDNHRPDDPRRRDSHALYELVQSVREEVCLVPIARDPLTGDPRMLSLLGRDLEEYAEDQGATVQVTEVPLHRREQVSDAAFTWTFPEAQMEHDVAAFGHLLRHGATPQENTAAEHNVAAAKAQHALPDVRALPSAWRHTLGVAPLPALGPRNDSLVEVPLRHVMTFLEYPTRGYAQLRLGYRAEGEDRAALDDEPFEHNALVAFSVLQSAIYEVSHTLTPDARTDPTLLEQQGAAAYDRVVARRSSDGTLPVGFFRDLQRTRDLESVARFLTSAAAQSSFHPPYQLLKWGRGSGFHVESPIACDPVELMVSIDDIPRRVRVSGLGNCASTDCRSLFRWHTSVKDPFGWGIGFARKALLPLWLDHLLLSCGRESVSRTAFVSGHRATYTATFAALPAETARAHLAVVLQGLLSECTGYCCPSVALLNSWEDYADDIPWATRRAKLEDDIRELFDPQRHLDTEAFSPVRRVESLRLPTEAEFASVRARYAAFIETVAQTPGDAEGNGTGNGSDDSTDDGASAGNAEESP